MFSEPRTKMLSYKQSNIKCEKCPYFKICDNTVCLLGSTQLTYYIYSYVYLLVCGTTFESSHIVYTKSPVIRLNNMKVGIRYDTSS